MIYFEEETKMPGHYLYKCDKCGLEERRYRNVRRCQCGGNLVRIEIDVPCAHCGGTGSITCLITTRCFVQEEPVK